MDEHDRDIMWLLAIVGVLAVGHLLHSWMIDHLRKDVEFAVGAASAAVARETETS